MDDWRSEKRNRKTIQAELGSFSLFIDFEIEKYKKKQKHFRIFTRILKKMVNLIVMILDFVYRNLYHKFGKGLFECWIL